MIIAEMRISPDICQKIILFWRPVNCWYSVSRFSSLRCFPDLMKVLLSVIISSSGSPHNEQKIALKTLKPGETQEVEVVNAGQGTTVKLISPTGFTVVEKRFWVGRPKSEVFPTSDFGLFYSLINTKIADKSEIPNFSFGVQK